MAIRLTETRLRQIIREEVRSLVEGPGDAPVLRGGLPPRPTNDNGELTPDQLDTIFKVAAIYQLFNKDGGDVLDMGRWPGEVANYPEDPVNQIQDLRRQNNPVTEKYGYFFMFELGKRLRKFNIKGPTTGRRLVDKIMGPGSADRLESWWRALYRGTRGYDPMPNFADVESMDLDGAIDQLKNYNGSVASRKAAIRGDRAMAGRAAYREFTKDMDREERPY